MKFVYDGYKLVEELDGLNSDALSHRYVWQTDAVGLDVPVSVYDTATDKTYFYHTDANKNITELTDNTSAVVAHYEYSPFGMQTVTSGAFASDNPFRFSSEYYDVETGLVYYNYRYYSPRLGRWLSRDPIEEEGGWNLYNTLQNNPVDFVDGLGLEEYDPVKEYQVESQREKKEGYDSGEKFFYYFLESLVDVYICGKFIKIVKTLTKIRGKQSGGNNSNAPNLNDEKSPRIKAKDRIAAEKKAARDKKGYDPQRNGTPRNNRKQNEQTDSIGNNNKMTEKQRRTLHDEVTGEDLTYQEIEEIAKDIKNNGKN